MTVDKQARALIRAIDAHQRQTRVPINYMRTAAIAVDLARDFGHQHLMRDAATIPALVGLAINAYATHWVTDAAARDPVPKRVRQFVHRRHRALTRMGAPRYHRPWG